MLLTWLRVIEEMQTPTFGTDDHIPQQYKEAEPIAFKPSI